MFDEDLLDLHGMSLKIAEQTVTSYILSRSSRRKIQKVRIVTGRGNHINAKGNRGVIYQNFESWLTKSQLKERIYNITKGDGYYIIELKVKPENDISHGDELPLEEFFYTLNTDTFMSLVEQKIPLYLFLYARLLEQGKHVTRNEKSAFQYYMMAAEAQFDEAVHAVARCYLHGIGTKLNDELANKWLQKADKLGIKWLKIASTNGSQQATMQLYQMFPNDETLLELAVEQGSILNYVLQVKRKGKKLSDEEMKQISKSIIDKASKMTYIEIVQLDNITRYFFIDELLLSKNKKFSKIALSALNHMADHNNIQSIRRLAMTIYFNGYYLQRDMQKVSELLQKGVQNNDSKCMITLGFLYLTQTLPPSSDVKPEELFNKSALLSNPNGYFILAYMHLLLLKTNLSNNPNILDAFTPITENLRIAIYTEQSLHNFNDLESGIIDVYHSIIPISESLLLLIDNMLSSHIYTTRLRDILCNYLQNLVRSIVWNLPDDTPPNSTEISKLFHETFLSELKAVGDFFASQKNYQAALEKYQQYIKHNQYNEKVYCNIGLMYKNLGQNSLAISAFNQAITLQPNYIKALFNLANIYAKSNQNTLAQECFNQILLLDPDYHDAKKNYAHTSSKKEDLCFNQQENKFIAMNFFSGNGIKEQEYRETGEDHPHAVAVNLLKPLSEQNVCDGSNSNTDIKTLTENVRKLGLYSIPQNNKSHPCEQDNSSPWCAIL